MRLLKKNRENPDPIPLSPRAANPWHANKRKGGRPRIGRGAARVLISIERGLLEEADTLARQRRLTRSELFRRGVKALMTTTG